MSVARAAPARITSLLVKVASRCNLDCDYCYVYHHADQSWRTMPKILSAENRAAFAERLAAYVQEARLKRCAVVFHGGEPLLAGVDTLVEFAGQIRAATKATVEIGLQTNGLLLNEAALKAFEQADIAVSLSLDGPREANDRHRTTRKGRSSFGKVLLALERLKRYPKVFAGVIAVIDASNPPEELFAFFKEHQPPKLDFLLPDAHHLRPPPGRENDKDLYKRWLIRAFDLWLDSYPTLPVRTFEALLDAASGLPTGTDAFGLGDVSLITVETDGAYHDLDVLKVTRDGATKLVGTVQNTGIAEVAASPQIAAHRLLLSKEGLCQTCRSCSIVDVCGGGSLPHRYGPGGFDHPTVYCGEMLALVGHVRERLAELLVTTQDVGTAALPSDIDLDQFELAENATETMQRLCADAQQSCRQEFLNAVDGLDTSEPTIRRQLAELHRLDSDQIDQVSGHPGAVAWQRTIAAQAAGRSVYTVDGTSVRADASYLDLLLRRPKADRKSLGVGQYDPWLRAPFGDAILFEDEEVAARARPLVEEALAIVDRWRPALGAEIRQACRAIQFVRDPLAHPDKIVSFSDNTVPGALYVSVVQGDGLIDPYDLADSLVHEHRHQKLYLLERLAPMVAPNGALVVSPWREDLRPPSGLLHAAFVFVELGRFWAFIRDHGPSRLHNRAVNQLQDTNDNLKAAFQTLDGCALTTAGRKLTSVLKAASEHHFAPAA